MRNVKSMVLEFGYEEVFATYDKENGQIKYKVGEWNLYRYNQEPSEFTKEKLIKWVIPQIIYKFKDISKKLDQIQSLSCIEDY